jgi:hypothetical protein
MTDAHSAKPRKRVLGPLYRTLLRSLPENRFGDRMAACIRFVRHHGRLPRNAMTYNDVLYRIKTSADILDPLRVFVSDKELVKLYVKAVVGDEYNVPTIDVIRKVEAVDTYEFPPDCCIKPTHASGRVILRRNGAPVDRPTIKSWFRINHYRIGREANYKTLEPKVIIEPLIFGSSNVEDYKIFCLNGVPRLIQVDVDRYIGHKRRYFDADWRDLDFSIKYPRSDKTVPRPPNLAAMLAIAAALSKHFGFVRIDLYSDGNQLLVGEITHVADNADGRFIPLAAEKIVSDFVFAGPAEHGRDQNIRALFAVSNLAREP